MKRILIAIVFIAYLTGGILMIRGFGENKCAYEVYSKEDFATITGTVSIEAGSSVSVNIEYPTGFTNDNTVVLSIGSRRSGIDKNYTYGYYGKTSSAAMINGGIERTVTTDEDNLVFLAVNPSTGSTLDFDYKIVLMKIGE